MRAQRRAQGAQGTFLLLLLLLLPLLLLLLLLLLRLLLLLLLPRNTEHTLLSELHAPRVITQTILLVYTTRPPYTDNTNNNMKLQLELA